MERVYVTFSFRIGQTVRWQTFRGPQYVVLARRYVDGQNGLARYEYLLHSPRLHGFDFWTAETNLLRDWEVAR